MSSILDTIRAVDSDSSVELTALSKHSDPTIRAYVAENRHTPAEILEILADDKESIVLIYLLRNSNLPPHIFLKLLKNIPDPLVKREASYNAILKYKRGELVLTHEELLQLVKIVDKKVDNLTLIEAVENLHFLHEKFKCK